MQRRLGALSQVAIVSYDVSNCSVIRFDAVDWPRCTLSYQGVSLPKRSISSRGVCEVAALLVTTRPVPGKSKWLLRPATSSCRGGEAVPWTLTLLEERVTAREIRPSSARPRGRCGR